MSAEPLILTLGLDADSFARVDAERRAFFPPALNKIPAHLTLFHHLPGEELAAVVRDLTAVAAARTPFAMTVSGLLKLGRGTAYRIESPELVALRRDLAARFDRWLTPQDRQGFRPHVTVQNKVAPDEARAVYERLAEGFTPFEVRAESLLLWRYLGGPWGALGEYAFSLAR